MEPIGAGPFTFSRRGQQDRPDAPFSAAKAPPSPYHSYIAAAGRVNARPALPLARTSLYVLGPVCDHRRWRLSHGRGWRRRPRATREVTEQPAKWPQDIEMQDRV